MIITTTPNIETRPVRAHCGVVAGEALLGAKLLRDVAKGADDIVRGGDDHRDGSLHKARSAALQAMEQEAEKLGANAVVGVDIDYETIGDQDAMMLVSVCGTAVVIDE